MAAALLEGGRGAESVGGFCAPVKLLGVFCAGSAFSADRASAAAGDVPSLVTGDIPGPIDGVLDACFTLAADAAGGLSLDAHAGANAAATRIPQYLFICVPSAACAFSV